MRKVMAAAMVVLSACAASTSESGVAGSANEPVDEWTTSLQELRGSGVRGQATVRSRATGGTVNVSIAGAQPDAQHPWHVHRGLCGGGGSIIGGPEGYPDLRVGTDGTARNSATLPVALEAGAQYHVNIHRSRSDMATIIACGNLTR